METKPIKLTPLQRDWLQALAAGGMLVPDAHNLLWLGDRIMAHMTREFLIKHRLITRFDKTRDIKTKGNGFVISDKGREVLALTAQNGLFIL